MDRSGPALPPTDALLAACIEQTHDLVVVTDLGGRRLLANRRFEALFGTSASLTELAPPGADGDASRAALEAALAAGGLEDTQLTLCDLTGAPLPARARASRVGEHLLWHLQDQREQRALARQAQHLADLLDMAQEFGRIGVWEREIPSGRGRWDRHVFGFWGLDPAQGTPDFKIAAQQIHPEDRIDDQYNASTRQAGHYSSRYRVVQPDGNVRWLQSQWEVRNGPTGTPERAIGIMMDDTPVYELARSLGDASAQLKLAVELADIAIWRHDLTTNRMHYNDRAFVVLGIPSRPDGLSIAEVRSFIHPDDLPRVLASAQQALKSDRPTDMEARYRRSDGSWRHVLTRRVVQRAPDGTALAFLGVALDVTDQVQHAREATELAHRLELTASAAGIGIWTRDTVEETGTWNAQMYELAGRPLHLPAPDRAEWLDRIVHPEDRAQMQASRDAVMAAAGRMVEQEFRIVRPDGEVRWMVNRARSEMLGGHLSVIGVTLDVTERRRTEAALRSADERAALAARSAGIGTWEATLDGTFERWDEQMFRLRGLAPQPQPPSREQRLAMVHPDDRAHNIDAVGTTLASPEVARYEFRVVLPDGSLRWLASRSIPVFDETGKVQRRLGVNWDVSDARDAELARQRIVVAERASQAKSQFLARMSHELRTPLNAVLGFTQLLQIEADVQAAADRSAKLGHIRAAGEHLLSLIDGVLDLSGLEAGHLRLEPEPIALVDIVEQVLPLVTRLAQQHGIALKTAALSGAVTADRTRLVQVLVNLLSNAVKYNRPGGSVTISAGPDQGTTCIVVADTGRGMTGDQLAHLFEPFNRLGIEREGIEGTGIGLTIVKALVNGMGGTIDVRSRAGEGTTVEVRLPAADAAAAASAARETLPEGRGAHGGTILYVEDNAVNVLLVEELVRNLSGLAIVSVPTGAAGVARARELRPDLVLIDMQLPDFDGFEVLRRLRAQPETAGIACIALSANAMPDDIERARAAGFVDYWTKPIDFKAFLAALRRRFPSPVRAGAGRPERGSSLRRPAPASARRVVGHQPRLRSIASTVGARPRNAR